MTVRFPADIDDLVVVPEEITPGSFVLDQHLEQALLASNQAFRNQRTYFSFEGSCEIPAFDTAPVEEFIFIGAATYDADGGDSRGIRFVLALDVGAGSTLTVRVSITDSVGTTTQTSTGLTTDQYLAITVGTVRLGEIVWTVEVWATAGATASYVTQATAFDVPYTDAGAGVPSPALPNPSNN